MCVASSGVAKYPLSVYRAEACQGVTQSPAFMESSFQGADFLVGVVNSPGIKFILFDLTMLLRYSCKP